MVSLHARFQHGLALAPERPCWRVADRSTTYRDAHASALAIACAVLDAAVRDRFVFVVSGRTETAYAGLLGALYAGAGAAPLSVGLPEGRLRTAVETIGGSTFITDLAGLGTVATLLPAEGAHVVVVDSDGAALPAWARPVDPALALDAPREVAPDDVSYVMLTSGSTGRPKVVPVTHGNAAAYFDHLDRTYDFRADDVFSQSFEPGFDCAIFDLFCAWGNGACVAALTKASMLDLPGAVAENGITIWFSTPSAIGVVRRTGRLLPGSMPTLRWSFFAGEALRHDDAGDWSRAASNTVVENMYGPTETTVTVSAHRWSPASVDGNGNGIVPIGRMFPGHTALVVDGAGAESTTGEGELCLRGPQVFPGYLDPADDGPRFLEHGGERWYRTGDRVRPLPGADWAFLGRIDDQVKVNGNRVELYELDHAVRQCDDVTAAATVLVGGDLVVFYTGRERPPNEFARVLRRTLPLEIVPRRYVCLAELVYNSNGKVDRRALRAQAEQRDTAAVLCVLLDEAVAVAPDSIAVRDRSGAWTYRQLRDTSNDVARWLGEQGVPRNGRVLTALSNCREFVALLYGAARRGITVVPLHPDVRPYVVRSVVADCTPVLAVTGDATADTVRELGVKTFTPSEMWAALPAPAVEPAVLVPAPALPGDNGVLIYTSGSTAAPKGIVCPQERMLFAARAIADRLGYRPDDVVYCRTPLSFDYGLYQIFLTAIARAELVLADGPDLGLLQEIRDYGVTVVPAVPSLSTMLVRLGARDDRPTRLRMITNTGAALSQATIDLLRQTFPGVQVVRMYGITECKRVSIMSPEEELERPASVGRPLPGTVVVAVDDDGNEVPPDTVGQLVVDGPNVMTGYWRSAELTARAFRVDPRTGRTRLFTGDYGWLDTDGYLYFEGRRDDMFKRKGVRMSTIEIEAAACDVPGVAAAVAVAPDSSHDLVLFAEGTAAPAEIVAGLAERLEPAKVPARVEVVARLPLTRNGKLDRRVLADRLRAQG